MGHTLYLYFCRVSVVFSPLSHRSFSLSHPYDDTLFVLLTSLLRCRGTRISMADIRAALIQRVGFTPRDAMGWLYACRGLYQLKEYHLVIEGLSHCIRNETTMKEAQHLLAFSLLHSDQPKPAAAAFYKSIKVSLCFIFVSAITRLCSCC